jgi:hypothetical protein
MNTNFNFNKMRKRNFLKAVLGVAAAMLLTTGVYAQVANSDYAEYDANVTAPTNIDYVTLRTGGTTTMGYYALPDPVYHPSYSGPGWTLTAGFTWNWTIPTNPGGAASISGGGAPANYVEIDYTATGNYVVNVAEQAPAAFGGCADATPTVMNVTVIAPPSVGITTADPAQACGNQAAMTVDLSLTEAVPAALAGYAFAINETVENIDAGGTPIGAALVDNDAFVDYPTTAKLNTGNDLTGAASPYGCQFTTSALDVQNNLRTRYTYTLIKASDAPAAAADGVISAISQKSDYVAVAGGADYLTYAFTDNQIVIIVNPAPVTGPIYYVPNNFNY